MEKGTASFPKEGYSREDTVMRNDFCSIFYP